MIDTRRGHYTVLDDGTLMITDAGDSDQGSYTCIARNRLGEARASTVELRMNHDHHHNHHDNSVDNRITRHESNQLQPVRNGRLLHTLSCFYFYFNQLNVTTVALSTSRLYNDGAKHFVHVMCLDRKVF